MSIFTAAKLHTLNQKYVTLWGYVADPLVFVVNREVWASWSSADREIVRQAALDAGKQQVAIARAGLVEPDAPAIKSVQALGVTVTRLTPAEREAFIAATRKVYAQWKTTIGTELVNRAEAAIAARK